MAKKHKPVTDAQLRRIKALQWRAKKRDAEARHYGAGAKKPVRHSHDTKNGIAGTFGPAGPCRRIDPKTGEYLD